jgi:hypothetical protein
VPLDSDQPYLTVGTYPMKDAFGATIKEAAKNGSVAVTVGKDEVAFYDPDPFRGKGIRTRPKTVWATRQ